MVRRSFALLALFSLTAGCNPPEQQHWRVWEVLQDDCPTLRAPSIGSRVSTSVDEDGRFIAEFAEPAVCTEPEDDLRSCVFEYRYATTVDESIGEVGTRSCQMAIAIDRDRLGPTMEFLEGVAPSESEVETAAAAHLLIAALPVGWPVYLGVIAAFLGDDSGLSGDMMGY